MQSYSLVLSRLLGDGAAEKLASSLHSSPYSPDLRLPIALGQAYERSLGDRPLPPAPEDSAAHPAGVDPQRHRSRKASGAYYTPVAIAQYIVRATVTPALRAAAAQPLPPSFRILDPACGGGVFLVVAYQTLLDWRLRQCVAQLSGAPSATDFSGCQSNHPIYPDSQGRWRLTRRERERLLRSHLYGVDLDGAAVEVARLALGLQLMLNGDASLEGDLPLPDLGDRLYRGNALIGPGGPSIEARASQGLAGGDPAQASLSCQGAAPFCWQTAFPDAIAAGGFNVVVGNPPYLDGAAMAAHLPDWRRYCRQHYRTAVGNWDLFCVFIERAVDLCQPGGWHSFVVPNKLASAEYTAAVRSLLAQTTQLITLRDYSQVQAFAAAVYPLVYVVRKRQTPQASPPRAAQPPVTSEIMADVQRVKTRRVCTYASLVSHSGAWILQSPTQADSFPLQPEWPRLGAIAHILGAATVAEAYILKEQIGDRPDPPGNFLKIVNSGTLDPYALLWGQNPMRYLGDRYRHPVVAAPWLQTRLPTRHHQATQPKLIVAGLTQRLECGFDEAGAFLAGKSTSIILSATVPLLLLLGLLNSPFASQLFRHLFGGNGLSGGYLRVGPPQLRQLPVPPLARLQGEGGDRLMAVARQRLDLQSQGSPADRTAKLLECDRIIDHLVRHLYQGDGPVED